MESNCEENTNHMNTLPLVSILIPAYNSETHLGRAIESVLAQTYKNIECIVINDGSTDNTESIAYKYKDHITYIFQKNSGASSARNRGIAAARGKYTAFLDADDYWTASKIELQVNTFSSNPSIALIYTKRKNHTERIDYRKAMVRKTLEDQTKVDIHTEFKDLFLNPYLTTSTVMIKTSILKDIGGFDESLITAEDLDLYFKCCWGNSFAKINEPLVYKEELQTSLGNKTRSYSDNLLVIDRLIERNPDFAKEFGILINERKQYIYSRWIQHLIYYGRGGEARKLILKNLKKPSNYWQLFLKSYIAKLICLLKKRTSPD